MKTLALPRHGSTWLYAALVVSLVWLTAPATRAQVASRTDRAPAESLTQSLLALHAQYRAASAEERTGMIGQLRLLAAQRQQFLSGLIQTSPGEVLRVAIPGNVAATLPRSVRNSVEQETDAQGELTVAYEDAKNGATLHHFIQTGGQRLELKFAANAPTNLLTGARVHVHGTRIGSALALGSGTSPTSFAVTQPASLPSTFGAQSTLVMLVNFQDNSSQPWSVTDAQTMVFTTASNFWLNNSFQQTWLAGDVAGWYTLPMTSTTCDTTSIQTYAQQAAQNAGYVLSNYSRYVYMFPEISACGWSGYSYIGGIPSSSWVNGAIFQQVVSHELGHALGLYHSHSLGCGTAVYAASGCTSYEYGDYYETMGNSSVNGFSMDYNAYQKERLGWLNYSAQPPITAVTATGTYQIGPYENQDTTAKALKIVQSATANTYYYVEQRQALGDDSALSNSSVPGYSEVLNGVVIHLAAPNNANSSDLLNMNPASSWGTAMALDVGQSYTDATAGVTISPIAVSSAGATVQVTVAGATCTHANPSLSISPGQSAWVLSGTSVSFTATLINNDSAACSSSSFNLAAGLPSGWSSSFSSSVLTLSPGASATTNLQVTSFTGTVDGFYSFTATAASGSYSASASATYVISTPPSITMSVSTDKSSYSSNQTALITVTVLSGSAPDAGVSVSGSITPPRGGAVTFTGTTGSNGTATFSYQIRKKATTGTYQVQVGTTAVGASKSTGASTTFTVQ